MICFVVLLPEEENLNVKRRVQQKRKPLEDCCTFPSQVKAAEVRGQDYITQKSRQPHTFLSLSLSVSKAFCWGWCCESLNMTCHVWCSLLPGSACPSSLSSLSSSHPLQHTSDSAAGATDHRHRAAVVFHIELFSGTERAVTFRNRQCDWKALLQRGCYCSFYHSYIDIRET